MSVTYGDRLNRAILARYPNVLEACRDFDMRGGSYAQVRRYIDGTSEPTLSVVVTMARKLGVFPEWLAFGHGHPTVACGGVAGSLSEHDRDVLRRLLDNFDGQVGGSP